MDLFLVGCGKQLNGLIFKAEMKKFLAGSHPGAVKKVLMHKHICLVKFNAEI